MNRKALRVLKGFQSQEKLAEAAGVSRSTIQSWERSEQISVTSAKKIAAALDCDWRIFFDDVDYKCSLRLQDSPDDDPAA